jgi:hypothetical protein
VIRRPSADQGEQGEKYRQPGGGTVLGDCPGRNVEVKFAVGKVGFVDAEIVGETP